VPNPVDLVQLGATGAFAYVVWREVHAARAEARADRKAAAAELRAERDAEAADRERVSGWLVAIHSRLGSLGAETMPPPAARRGGRTRSPESRQRVDTPPPIVGVLPTVRGPEDEG
jgi:hypothetical protein